MSLKKLIAPSTFITSPTNALATLDVYKKSDAAIVNKIMDIAKSYDPDLVNIIKGGEYISKRFPIIQETASKYLEVNKENLIARISAISSPIRSAVKGVSDTFKAGVESLGITGEVFTKIKGVASKVRNTDFDNLNSIGKLIHDVTGDESIFTIEDKDSFAALFIGIVKEASAHGIPNSLSALTESIVSTDTFSSIVKDILPITIETSDVRMLKTLVDTDNTKLMRVLNSNAVYKFTKEYKGGNGFKENEEKEEYKMMTESFESIDDLWNKKLVKENGNYSQIIDLTKLKDASVDFNNSMMLYLKDTVDSDPTQQGDEVFMALRYSFGISDVRNEVKQLLPYSTTNESKLNSPDPINPFIEP